MALPSSWNRARATALGVTLLLHAVVATWLLTLRFDSPPVTAGEAIVLWFLKPVPPPPVPPPQPETSRPGIEPAVAARVPIPEPPPSMALSPPLRDWHDAAREVAGAIGRGPSRRKFGEIPKVPAGRPREEYPPSIIFEKPLPRVGETVTTPEGETILWVSDKCYISLGTRSLTMAHIHQARQGIRRCNLALGKAEPRGDLFDSIKRPPPPQEPGCGPDGIGLSCGR